MNQNRHLYICGGIRMAAGVTSAFENGLCKHFNMSREQAEEYIVKLKVTF